MRFLHIINPVDVGEASELRIAQTITFESMRQALHYSANQTDYEIEVVAVCYAEDVPMCPVDFSRVELIERSLRDRVQGPNVKKLPFLSDLLDCVNSVECDYVIYTNVDIALQPYFYQYVYRMIGQGYDAFVINRRTISDQFTDVAALPYMYAQGGTKHRGFDCFIFNKAYYAKMVLKDICIGQPGIGLALVVNMFALGRRFCVVEHDQVTFHVGNDRSWQQASNNPSKHYNVNQCNQIVKSVLGDVKGLELSALPGWAARKVSLALGVKFSHYTAWLPHWFK